MTSKVMARLRILVSCETDYFPMQKPAKSSIEHLLDIDPADKSFQRPNGQTEILGRQFEPDPDSSPIKSLGSSASRARLHRSPVPLSRQQAILRPPGVPPASANRCTSESSPAPV